MLNELIEISSGFQSSVNIAYDLKNDSKIQGFIPTISSFELMYNILLSVSTNSTQRAKILTGAYGRGKSHIVLVILAILCRNNKDKKMFGSLLDKMKIYYEDLYKLVKNYLNLNKKLLPVIINGNSSSLTQSFMNALQQSLSSYNMEDIMPDTHFQAAENTIRKWKKQYPNTYEQFSRKITVKVNKFIHDLQHHSTQAYQEFIRIYPDLTAGSLFNPFVGFDVADLFEQVSIAVKERGYDGLYVVYDEFGKYLESSIASATESDTKLLQDFAEKCNRSEKNQMHILLICHKDISNYIDMNLPKDKVDGWRGISGRFEHINLHNNYSQIYEIISAVIEKNPKKWEAFCNEHEETFSNLAERYSTNHLLSTDKISARNTVISCYPLHPSTTYILPRLSEKVAQNERTLFTFLSANQKNTLVEYIDKNTETFPFVTPDYLYDYFEMQFRKELNSTEIHKIYQLASNVLKKVKKGSLQSKIIKTIALIYMIEQFEKFPPTVDTITDTFLNTVCDPKEITNAITDLVDNACIVYLRRSNHYLKLKNSSGVDIKEEIRNRIEKLRLSHQPENILNTLTFENYLYPTKYNDVHCITRYFAFQFISSTTLQTEITEQNDQDASGVVQAVFFTSEANFHEFDFNAIPTFNNQIVTVIPREYIDITAFAYEYKAVQELKIEAKDDDILSDEYDVYLEDLDVVVHHFINSFTHPELNVVDYFYKGEQLRLYRKAQLSALLTQICEEIYTHTPIINNESINKNLLSTTAVNSRTKLITALLESDVIEKNLGLTGTGQEVSFMRSLLIQTGILIQDNDSCLLTITPENPEISNILASILNFFRNTPVNGETSFTVLYHELTSIENGIGLKRGVIPVFIAVVLNAIKHDIIIKYHQQELRINADLLNSINENPDNYTVVMEDWNQDKSSYLRKLEEIFSEFIVRKEQNYNSFTYIAFAMNRWYMFLPKCAKEMTAYYDTEENVPQEYINFIRALKQQTNNTRTFLMEEIPLIFGRETVALEIADSINYAKERYENAKLLLTNHLINITKNIFHGAAQASLSSILKDWYETLNRYTLQHQFPDTENTVISLISTITNDDTVFINRLAKAVTGLRLDDWNNSHVKIFSNELTRIVTSINDYNEEERNHNEVVDGTCRMTFTNEAGQEVTRVFEKIERSRVGKLLYNEITSAIDETGRSLTQQEKSQVLIEILKTLCQ